MKKFWPEVWDFVKKNFVVLVIVTIVLILWGKGCFKRFEQQPPIITIVRDSSTTQQPQPVIVMPPYQPQAPVIINPSVPPQYNPSADIAKLTAQYNEIVKQFLAVKTYKDSIQLKDSTGNRVGVVDLTQVVSENELKSTQPTYQLSFPHTTITNTITIREPYKPRNQVYVGAGVDVYPSINQVNAGFLFKNKRDVMLGLSGTYSIPNNKAGAQISIYKLIKLKK